MRPVRSSVLCGLQGLAPQRRAGTCAGCRAVPPDGLSVDEHRLDAIGRRRRVFEVGAVDDGVGIRSEEHTSELQSLMRISYAVFCLKKKNRKTKTYSRVRNGEHEK